MGLLNLNDSSIKNSDRKLSKEREQTHSPDSFNIIDVDCLEQTDTENQSQRIATCSSDGGEQMRQSSPAAQSSPPRGLVSSVVEATTSLSTSLLIHSIKPFTPYLNLAAQTALKTAQSESKSFALIGHSGQLANEHMKILSVYGTQLIESAQKAQKHIAQVKNQKLQSQKAFEALILSGTNFFRTFTIRAALAFAGSGLLSMGDKIIKGNQQIIPKSYQTAKWSLALILASAMSAIVSSEGKKFRETTGQWLKSYWEGGSAGVDAATVLAESLIHSQILLGSFLKCFTGHDDLEDSSS